MQIDDEVMKRLLTEFNKPVSFKGDSGIWNDTITNMEDVFGRTLAYVDDTNNLIIYDVSTFADIISSKKYITIAEYSEKHQKGVAIIKRLCGEGRIEGAYKTSAGWLIPSDAPYPERKPRTIKNKIYTYKALDHN